MNSIEVSPLQRWQDHLRAGELSYQYSPDAGRAVFYPRVLCPFGGQAPLEWRISTGCGEVHSISLVHPVKGDAYAVGLIELDEGFRMMAQVEGATGSITEIGRRVVLRMQPPIVEGGVPVPAFVWEQDV